MQRKNESVILQICAAEILLGGGIFCLYIQSADHCLIIWKDFLKTFLRHDDLTETKIPRPIHIF